MTVKELIDILKDIPEDYEVKYIENVDTFMESLVKEDIWIYDHSKEVLI